MITPSTILSSCFLEVLHQKIRPIHFGSIEIRTRAAGWEAWTLPLCHATPTTCHSWINHTVKMENLIAIGQQVSGLFWNSWNNHRMQSWAIISSLKLDNIDAVLDGVPAGSRTNDTRAIFATAVFTSWVSPCSVWTNNALNRLAKQKEGLTDFCSLGMRFAATFPRLKVIFQTSQNLANLVPLGSRSFSILAP